MPIFAAIYDACVLYPAPLRDLLMQLAQTGLFRARWTNQIHDEWMENLLKDRTELKRDRLERTRDLMNTTVRDCLVTDYESLIPTLTLPDKDDRHVLAAAIKGRVDVIVTFNLKDFPDAVLKPYEIQAKHPDDFVTDLIDYNNTAIYTAVKRQRENLRNPPKTAEQLIETLEKCSLTQTAIHLRDAIDLL